MNTNLHFQIAVTQLYGIGPKRTKELIDKVNSLENIFQLSIKQLAKSSGISPLILKKMNREYALRRADQIIRDIKRHTVQTHFLLDNSYPKRLHQAGDSPCLVYSKGNVDLNASRMVAIVGTRNATAYGKRFCEDLIQSFIGKNITVVSGLAYGIDIHVHELCLKHKVPTIGILAHGLDIVYPTIHKRIAEKMMEQGGLVSEYPPYSTPDRENFPMRNRIVAALSDATIVVESKSKGGSLITAKLANDYNKDVFAVPGNVYQTHSQGCNDLISDDRAHLLQSGQQFLQMMNWDSEHQSGVQASLFPQLNAEEKEVVQFLSKERKHINYFIIQTPLYLVRIQ